MILLLVHKKVYLLPSDEMKDKLYRNLAEIYLIHNIRDAYTIFNYCRLA
jgi:hypothetical protein